MKTSLLTLLMVAGLATVGFGAAADDLKTLEQQWLDAYMKGDAAVLKNIEADDFTIVEPDGTVTTKAEDIKSVTDKKFSLKSATMSDYKCRMIGENAAVVTAMLKMSGSDEGKEFSGDFRAIDVFEKKDGKWLAVASQLTKVQKE
ncbi:MAG TPA: nuclear transport factor 2 family protein [Chthoniobacterales bacterium]|nr:nuclear transport factor 2 family protein [Chthoniobacterales bacterium]